MTDSTSRPTLPHHQLHHRVRHQLRALLAPVPTLARLLLALALTVRTTVRRDDGMSTAEYAVGTVAAVAFAAILYKVVRSEAVSSALSSIIRGALNVSL